MFLGRDQAQEEQDWWSRPPPYSNPSYRPVNIQGCLNLHLLFSKCRLEYPKEAISLPQSCAGYSEGLEAPVHVCCLGLGCLHHLNTQQSVGRLQIIAFYRSQQNDATLRLLCHNLLLSTFGTFLFEKQVLNP